MYKGYKNGNLVATATTAQEVEAMKANPIYRGIAWVEEKTELPKFAQEAIASRKKAKDDDQEVTA